MLRRMEPHPTFVPCTYEKETAPSRQQIGIELTWLRYGNIGRSSEAKERQRKFGRKRRLVRRKERRSKRARCSFTNVHRIAGIYPSFLCFPYKGRMGIGYLVAGVFSAKFLIPFFHTIPIASTRTFCSRRWRLFDCSEFGVCCRSRAQDNGCCALAVLLRRIRYLSD